MVEVDIIFFELKLREFIEYKYNSVDKYNPQKYIQPFNDIVAICMASSMAFRHFYKITAELMIQYDYPAMMQQFVDQFIEDVRTREYDIERFYRMYDDDLYNFVKIVSELDETMDSGEFEIVANLLKYLKTKCFFRFVVIVTHFSHQFKYFPSEITFAIFNHNE